LPTNLQECVDHLVSQSGPLDKIEILRLSEDDFVGRSHHTLGRQIRNNWELWQENELVQYFKGLGLHHADDMSGLILRSFYRTLKEVDLDVPSIVKKYQDYWARTKQ
jgi:hypothetical protein